MTPARRTSINSAQNGRTEGAVRDALGIGPMTLQKSVPSSTPPAAASLTAWPSANASMHVSYLNAAAAAAGVLRFGQRPGCREAGLGRPGEVWPD